MLHVHMCAEEAILQARELPIARHVLRFDMKAEAKRQHRWERLARICGRAALMSRLQAYSGQQQSAPHLWLEGIVVEHLDAQELRGRLLHDSGSRR